MRAGDRVESFVRCLALSSMLAGCATVKSTEELEEVDDRAAEGEPDAGSGQGDGKNDGDDDTESVTDEADADDANDSGDGDGEPSDDGPPDDSPTDDGPTDDGPTDDGPTDDGPTDDDGTPDTTCITPTVGSGSDGLIDDLDDGNHLIALRDGRNGYWVVYDDDSAAAPMPSNDGDLTPTMVGPDSYVAQVAGGPYTTWGASVGFSLRRGPQGEVNCPYDATAYSGIRFKAKGSGSVRFKVRDATTDADPESYDGHGAPVTLTSTLTTYTLCFASMVQEYGATTNLQKNKMLNMHWQVDTGVTMSLTLDDVTFVAGACTNSP